MIGPWGDPEEEARRFVRRWLKLLAEGRWEDACALLEPDDHGIAWTPAAILDLLHDTFPPDSVFYERHPGGPAFTDPDELPEIGDARAIALDDGSGWWLDCPVPLNHERGDLTAQLELRRRGSGYVAILHDLHVL